MAVTRSKARHDRPRDLNRLLISAWQKHQNLRQWMIERYRRIAARIALGRSVRVVNQQTTPLTALAASALALLGAAAPAVAADEVDGITVQYGSYNEGTRYIGEGLTSRYKPIHSDSLQTRAYFTSTEGIGVTLNYAQDTWSGATPIATAPAQMHANSPLGVVSGATPYLLNASEVYVDKATKSHFLKTDGFGTLLGGFDDSILHTLSGASPETRKQVDLKLSTDYDSESSYSIGAGISVEPDYLSKFMNVGGKWDFNQKLTTLNLGMSYTSSETKAIIDHDANPYIFDAVDSRFNVPEATLETEQFGKRTIHGERTDWGATASVTQILNKTAVIEAGIGYTRTNGYLGNPYKVVEVGFIDPDNQLAVPEDSLRINFNGLLEQRPTERNAGTVDLSFVQHIEPFDAALHLGYRYFQDDWGIKAHTFTGSWAQPLWDGWTLTPHVRYYSQDAADFYTPFLITDQASTPNVKDPVRGQVYLGPDGNEYFEDPNVANPDGVYQPTGNPVVDANGNPVSQEIADQIVPKQTLYDRSKLPKHFSSDHRLSAYGALGYGLTLGIELAKGAKLEFAWEHYTHADDLKMFGGGEGNYSDFNSDTVSASLKIDLAAAFDYAAAATSGHEGHGGMDHGGMSHGDGNADHAAHNHSAAPAGVMLDHMLPKSGDVMVGYRYAYRHDAGGMLNGTRRVSDAEVKAVGCDGGPCQTTPDEMNMHMHMLDIMYAPAPWLTLMVMPQYMDMNMGMRGLLGEGEFPEQIYYHHILHDHTTGAIGDTEAHALVRLFDTAEHHMHAGIGVSAPTGDVGIKLRDTHGAESGMIHYGMQIGSGTWDLKPSLTYTGQSEHWFWGAQGNATIRLEDKNESGYRLGDVYSATAWGGYRVSDGVAATVRGLYTHEGEISGGFTQTFLPLGPNDYVNNYGGEFVDVGFGLTVSLADEMFKKNSFSLEWLQPVVTDANGYQLDRVGTLAASWKLAF